jgi:uncharacterized protein DUF1549/uncharacterized protein DUF1553
MVVNALLVLALVADLSPAQIDRMVRAEWRKHGVTPAPRASDAAFLRRVWLDLSGTIPPADEVKKFLADPARDKRARAVDALLASPRYADHFTDYWDNVLLGRRPPPGLVDRVQFRRFLHEAFEENRSWAWMAHELVAAVGRNSPGGPKKPLMAALFPPTVSKAEAEGVNGATNWLLRFAQTPQDVGGTTARIFLGVRIQCAQCHDHPSEKWKQDDFRRFTAIFAKTGLRPVDPKEMGMIRRVDLIDGQGAGFGMAGNPELRAMAIAKPTALDGTDFSSAPMRRTALADWMIRPDNPWFARAFVNRMWAYLLGRGFVEPIDDFRRSNPAVAPEILDALAADFAAHNHDIKRLIRQICATEAYQRAAAPAKGPPLWQHYRLRPLRPEELLAAVSSAVNLDNIMQLLAYKADKLEKLKLDVKNAVTFLFDVDEDLPSDDYEGTIPQALMLLNGQLTNGSIAGITPGSALRDLLRAATTDEEKIEALYLRTLSRPPSKDEMQHWLAFVNAPHRGLPQPLGPKQLAYEDFFWALLNSSEFVTRH